MEILKSYKKENRIFEIIHDPYPLNPREEFDQVTTMVCTHKRYKLGDGTDINFDNFSSWDGLEDHLRETYDDILAIKPLYLYDHSGLALSTTGFSCPWDSGQIGFVFITKSRLEEMGYPLILDLEKIIEADVKAYHQFLNGDTYGFRLKEVNTCDTCKKSSEEELDSCWGFYGDDIRENGILENVGMTNQELEDEWEEVA